MSKVKPKQYGNMNVNLREITNKITQNQDILKFLFYNDLKNGIENVSEVGLDDLLGMTGRDEEDKENKKQQIFPHKKIPVQGDTNFKSFISMEYGAIIRNDSRNRKSNLYFKGLKFGIFLIVPQTLDDTGNGSRLMALEKCIEDTFHGKSLDAISDCYIVASEPYTVPDGYIGRVVTLSFADKNEGVMGG